MSQLDLALAAEISSRHLAFLETGRAQPSRIMVGQLSETLDVPLQARNDLLLAAGFAPAHTEHTLDHAALVPLSAGLDRLLTRHEPYPGILLDRYLTVLKANRTAALLFDAIGGDASDMNLLTRLANNPHTGEVIENWPAIAAEFLSRLRAEVLRTSDAKLGQRLDAFAARVPAAPSYGNENPFLCMRIRLPDGTRLALFSAIGQFSAARDITAADLRIELFFPADAETEKFLSST
jgi:transcriptional regulator with XRE-family HTH domain